MAIEGLGPYFQIELYKSGRMDAMRVLVEVMDGSVDKEAVGGALTKRIKDMVGISTKVVVGEPGSVARSQGTAVRVLDNRG